MAKWYLLTALRSWRRHPVDKKQSLHSSRKTYMFLALKILQNNAIVRAQLSVFRLKKTYFHLLSKKGGN